MLRPSWAFKSRVGHIRLIALNLSNRKTSVTADNLLVLSYQSNIVKERSGLKGLACRHGAIPEPPNLFTGSAAVPHLL
jgi:hypothetical protein